MTESEKTSSVYLPKQIIFLRDCGLLLR